MNRDDITDPSDWKSTRAAYMGPIESTLTCHICKELMTAPVLTSCCHTFCSLCIRSSLNSENKCPVCRVEIQASALKKNNVVEELIELYKPARPKLLELAKPKPKAPAATVPPKKRNKVSTDRDESARPRKAVKVAQEDGDGPVEVVSDAEREGDEVNDDSNDDDNDGDEGEVVVDDQEDDEDEDEDEDDIQVTKIEQTTPEKSNGEMGSCPICNKRMKISEIESTHIQSCLANGGDSSPSKPATSSFFHKRESKIDMTKKLAFVAYNMYNSNELRGLLSKTGLPTTGTRQQLQERYTEWVTLWNANADSKAPVSKSKLLAQLRQIEHTKSTNKKPQTIDSKVWNAKHKSEFENLIAMAKRS